MMSGLGEVLAKIFDNIHASELASRYFEFVLKYRIIEWTDKKVFISGHHIYQQKFDSRHNTYE